MAQDSINHIVQVIQPSNCKCDSVQYVINIPESTNSSSTNCCDVLNTVIVCFSILVIFCFILYCLNKATIAEKKKLLITSKLNKAYKELKQENESLKNELNKKPSLESLEDRIKALEDKVDSSKKEQKP